MKVKEIVAGVLMTVGMVLGLGAIGTMEFLGQAATESEMTAETVKAAISGVLMIASLVILLNDRKNSED